MERISKFYLTIGLVIALGLFYGMAAYADEANEATTITFSAPVQIPGQVLPTGTYLFQLASNGSDQNIVQIFNSTGTRLYASVPTIPTDQLQAKGHTEVTFAEQGAGTPDALLKWFYPGELTGHEFVYSTGERKQLALDPQQTIVTNPHTTNSKAQA